MKKLMNILLAGITGTAIIMACTNGTSTTASTTETTAMATEPMQTTQANQNQDARAMVKDWPETAKMAANNTMEKYGQPHGITPHMLVWHDTGPFKRTIVYKEEVQHDFPMPHKDVLEQFVNYQVPADKFDELAMYDGSVIAERTKGELSARCDKEGANILALNLADDIIKDKRTVDEARQFYADAIMQMLEGQAPAYMQSLQFSPPTQNVGFTDKTVMDMSKVKQLKQDK
ncbi:hypothetical protein ACFSRY_18265 [Pontibacter locisalis]|uniref:Lipoprotein n=1 Tax=Pontibacter locisalis TaxID=1719035 RepID=A0ABW5IS74_9BACT